MASKDRKSKDVGQIPGRKTKLSRKTRKYIRRALLENYPGMAKKYNKTDLDKAIDKQYELDTILPYAPIYYQEDNDTVHLVSNPGKKRPGQGQLIRYKTIDEAEMGERSHKDVVKYDYAVSSPHRDLESGIKHYDFSGRDENYDPEAGKNGGRKATRKSSKFKKSRKTRK
jgi:hypothetical protein